MTLIISTGTLAATNGSGLLTFTGAGLLPTNVKHGDEIDVAGVFKGYVDTIDFTAQTINMLPVFVGTSGSGKTYAIRRATPISVTASELLERTTDLLNDISVFDGKSSALMYKYNGLNLTAIDPGNGQIAFNNSSISSATEAYVDNLDYNLNTMNVLIGLWTAGTILVVRSADTGSVASFTLTVDASQQSGFVKLSLNLISSNGSFTNGEALTLGYVIPGISRVAGFRMQFSTSTTDADPGNGLFRANSGTFGSIGTIYMDVADLSGNNITAWLDSLDDATNALGRGYLRFTSESTPTKFMDFIISGVVTTATGYRKIAVTPVVGTLFTNNEIGAVTFQRSGSEAQAPGPRLGFNTATADADPGAGRVAFNAATAAATTILYVSNTDQSAATISTWIDTLDDSNNVNSRAFIAFQPDGSISGASTFAVTGAIVTGSGYRKIPVRYISGIVPANNVVLNMAAIPAGADGYTPGIYLQFDTSTAASDPGTGIFRFSSGTIASVTSLYIDDTDLLGVSIANYVDTFDDRVNGAARGYIVLQSAIDNSTIVFRVTGSVVNSTGYRTVTVAYVSGNLPANGSKWDLNFSASGADGRSVGIKYNFSTTTTAGDPGNGTVRFNNAAFASITQIYIDDVDTGSNAMGAWFDTMDDVVNITSSAGYLTIIGDFGSGQVYLFKVNSVVNSTGYRTIGVTPVVANTALPTNGGSLAVCFAANGADGRTPGVKYSFDTATTDALPASGNVRANNATFASITFLYINNSDASANALGTWFDSFDDATNAGSRGTLVLQGDRGSGYALAFKVTGAVIDSGTGYRKIPVTPISAAIGLPPASTLMALLFIPAGQDAFNTAEVQITTAGTLGISYNNQLVLGNSATALATTLATPAILGAGFGALLENIGVGTWTLTGTFDDGSTTLTLLTGQSVFLRSNGTVHRALLRGGGGGSGTVTATKDRLVGNGTAVYTLGNPPQSQDAMMVWVGGAIQGNSSFSISGTTLTLNAAVNSPTIIDVWQVRPVTIGVPSAGTVGANELKLSDAPAIRGGLALDLLSGLRNKLINGAFDIWQRTISLAAGVGFRYSVDRWWSGSTGSTMAVARSANSPGLLLGRSNPKYYAAVTVASSAGAGNYAVFGQHIEGVSQLAGCKITLTFWANASAARNIGIELNQNFGTGGSPSSPVSIPLGLKALTTAATPTRYDIVVDLPSITGKTLGTNGDDFLDVIFWLDSGATYATRSSSVGQQSGTYNFQQVSLVPGDATAEADPFSPRHIQQELALCQRYYQKSFSPAVAPAQNTGSTAGVAAFVAPATVIWDQTVQFDVSMRTIPTVVTYSPNGASANWLTNVNTPTASISYVGENGITIRATTPNAGYGYSIHWTADAEL